MVYIIYLFVSEIFESIFLLEILINMFKGL